MEQNSNLLSSSDTAQAAGPKPVAPPPADPQPTGRPALVPEKFWDADAGAVRVDALAKSYRELEKHMGGMVRVPAADSPPEERQRFLRALGVPDAPDAYDFGAGETEGAFRDVAVVGERTYVAVERAGGLFIEAFDEALTVDGGEVRRLHTPATAIAGLDRLEGQTVTIIADGTVRSDAVVENGSVPIGAASSEIAVGLPFSHVIEALPVAANFPRGPAQGASYRLVEVTFRLHETGALVVDLGDGPKATPFRQVGGNMTFGAPTPNFSGDKRLRALGWRRAGVDLPWRIEQAAPVPCTVLSVTTEIKVTD